MHMKEAQLKELAIKVGEQFRCFGGGKTPTWNSPVAEALKDSQLAFAAGVPVIDVVKFIVKEAQYVQTQKETSSD